MKFVPLFFVLALFTTMGASAVDKPQSGKRYAQEGKSRYFLWPDMDHVLSIEVPYSDHGEIIVRGVPAQELFEDMIEARHQPADPDLEKKKPAEISRSMGETKFGKNITCRRLPEMNSKDLIRDENGKVIYGFDCEISVASAKRGEVGETK